MSFIIWYKVEVAEAKPAGGLLGAVASLAGLGLPVTVSNDVFGGSVILDADITVTMTEGAAADTFEVTLVNLPSATTDLICDTLAGTPLNASIHLGYFDEPSTMTGPVLVGRITSVTGSVGADGLARTVLTGQEEGGYLLRTTPAAQDLPASATALELAGKLTERAGVPLADRCTLPGDLDRFTVCAGSTLDALRGLAGTANVPLVVRDGKVFLGAAVGAAADPAPVAFDPDTNLVSQDSGAAEDTVVRTATADPTQQPPPVRTTANLTVLGHPGLRVGQVATVTGLSGLPAGTLRVSRVVHRFTTRGGYTAELALVAAEPGVPAQVGGGVQGAVDRWRDVVDRGREDHPAIDVGEVTGYTEGKHLATLHYGQSPEPAVVSPSVASPVRAAVDLHDKPVASPFAFDRTGLVLPVYPGMRAVLAHNRGLVNDAVVTGFVWPENPAMPRPANQPGDYWLALPTRLGPDGRPQGPGANDLTDAAGNRVLQVASLHVLVGADKLPDVGTRPDPPTDGSITIEHHSGTTIAVDSGGAVTITTSGKAVTLTNGTVSMTLDGASVAVS